MAPTLYFYRQKIILILLSLSLIHCGGGGSTPARPDPDTTPPTITKTSPRSEQSGIATTDFITITFNEAIAEVGTNNVVINPVVGNLPVELEQIPLNNQSSFLLNSEKTVLEIRPIIGDLKRNTHYRVSVKQVKDIAGNEMRQPCQWDFTTLDAPAIILGKTGVCSTDPQLPDKVRDLTAIASDGVVTLNWYPADTGGNVSYYKIDKSTDNQQSFTTIEAKLPINTRIYPDNNVQNGQSYIYRVTAVNARGDEGPPAISNPVIPNTQLATIAPSSILVSPTVAKYNNFGYALSFSPEGSTLAVGEIQGDQPNAIDTGAVHIFSTATNMALKQTLYPPILPSNKKSNYGRSVAFSPDGKQLAVSEFGNSKVHIYTKAAVNAKWTFAKTLTAPATLNAGSNSFGYCVQYSPDSLTLAICDIGYKKVSILDAGAVYLWDTRQWTVLQKITAPDASSNSNFGMDVRFSPDGLTLAIQQRIDKRINDSVVYLFKQLSPINWLHQQKLESQKPIKLNLFGNLAFIDNKTLTLGEEGATTNGIPKAGKLQIYTFGTTWTRTAELIAQQPSPYAGFGNRTAITADGSNLAVLQYGSIQLFEKLAGAWVYSKLLADDGGFSPMAISSNGILAVGNANSIVKTTKLAGNVYLFKLSTLP